MAKDTKFVEMGRKAFKKGIESAAQDPEFMKTVTGMPGSNIKKLQEWSKGWVLENLKPDSKFKPRKK